MFEKKNQIKIEKNEMKAKKFDSKKYIGILCKHGMNGGDSSQEICLKALIIDYWKLLGCVRTMCVVHWVTFSFEIISVRLMMLCVAKDFHRNVFFFHSLWRSTLIPFNDIDHIWGLYLLRSMIEKCAAFKIKSSPNEARSLWHATSPRPSFILNHQMKFQSHAIYYCC